MFAEWFKCPTADVDEESSHSCRADAVRKIGHLRRVTLLLKITLCRLIKVINESTFLSDPETFGPPIPRHRPPRLLQCSVGRISTAK